MITSSLRPIAVTPNESKYPFGEDKNLLKHRITSSGFLNIGASLRNDHIYR